MDIWKLGCSWGDRSQAPVFYDLLIKRHIVICDSRSDLHKGDYAAIAIGHNIKAVAEILSDEEPSENRPYLEEDFTSYRIDIDGSFVSDANIYVLEKKHNI